MRSTPGPTNPLSLNPVLARRRERERADLVRHRINHLFAVTDQPITDRPPEAKPWPSDVGALDAGPPDAGPLGTGSLSTGLPGDELPEDWPRGYGRRRDHRRADPAAAPPAEADVGSEPAAATPDDGSPSPPTAALIPPPRTHSTTGSGSASTPSGSPRRPGSRFRPRLPPCLHSLLWVDRRAVLGLSVLLLLAVAYAVQHFWFGRPQPVAVPVASTTTAGSPKSAGSPAGSSAGSPAGSPAGVLPLAPAAATVPAVVADGPPDASLQQLPAVVVDVAGKVANPGLRSLPGGSRVADAVRAAGGAQPGVDTDELNLARILVDGEQILVGAPAPTSARAATAAPRAPVSLNRATWEQLDALPGIGPALAQHIVDFRSSHAGFRSLEQLRQINGIGERKFAELKPLLTL